MLFRDLTDWSIVEVNGMPEYRYNDRGVQRALADNEAPTYEFLVANGVEFVDQAPDNSGAHALGLSAKRENHCIWGKGQSLESPAGAGGTSLMRPLEASARKKGVKFLLNYHMDVIFREKPDSGRVLGIQASYTPTILPGTTTPLKSFRTDGNIDMNAKTVTVRAKKAVIIGTGGSTGNVNFRRMFDPRLTEEFPLAADEFSPQDASGELAAMAIGASLWGTANQTFDRNGALRKRPIIGTRTNYIAWTPKSPLFPKVGATGLAVRNWQDAIIVNQVGKRFYNEMEDGYPSGTFHGFLKPYIPGDWRNASRIKYTPMNYPDAALAINEGSAPAGLCGRAAVGHLRRRSSQTGEVEPGPACHAPRVFLQCQHAGGACGDGDEMPVPEGQDACREPGSDGQEVQPDGGSGRRPGFRQSPRPGTRSRLLLSMQPGRRSQCTTPMRASGST